ncbi:MAG: Gx transporter family protein [Eubacteriales bacterium]|jgi:heptaprenyl diphosphate synthase
MSTMSRADSPAARTARGAVLVSAALLLSYLESFIPLGLLLPLPGFRLGLANISIMFVFFCISATEAAVISAVRVIVMALLFGNPVSFFFSATGAAFSLAGMFVLKYAAKNKLSFWGISVISASLHNIGQLAAAAVLFGKAIISYLPALLFASAVFGSICGILLNILVPKILPAIRGGEK